MPAKRATVPDDAFKTKTRRTLDRLTDEPASEGDAPTAAHGSTVIPQGSATVLHPKGNEVLREDVDTVLPSSRVVGKTGGEKTTFYLRPAQLDQLDELVYQYKKRTGRRINRNDVVRQLIDQADVEALLGVQGSDRQG